MSVYNKNPATIAWLKRLPVQVKVLGMVRAYNRITITKKDETTFMFMTMRQTTKDEND